MSRSDTNKSTKKSIKELYLETSPENRRLIREGICQRIKIKEYSFRDRVRGRVQIGPWEREAFASAFQKTVEQIQWL